MSIEISRETELRLTAEARRLGISVYALLERLITEGAALTHAAHAGRARALRTRLGRLRGSTLPSQGVIGAGRVLRRVIGSNEQCDREGAPHGLSDHEDRAAVP
jgi:hypothetical protein